VINQPGRRTRRRAVKVVLALRLTAILILLGEAREFAYDAGGQRTTTSMNTESTKSFWEGKIVTSYDLAGRISAIEADNQETPRLCSRNG
jgi:YD repeat-containing protein